YDPYGKPTFENAANQPLKVLARFIPESPNHNAYLFQGMRYDPELGARSTTVNTDFGGLYADGAYYNPNEGRPMGSNSLTDQYKRLRDDLVRRIPVRNPDWSDLSVGSGGDEI